MSEYFTYTPIILSFIIDVTPINLDKVKDELVKPLMLLESDDRAYVYQKGIHTIERWPGKAVAMVANYKIADFNLRNALQETIYVASEHDPDADKYLFLISDKEHPNLRYSLEIISLIDKAEKYNTKIIAISIGDKINLKEVCEGLNVEGISLKTTESIGNIIKEAIKEKDGPNNEEVTTSND